jgi:23S rRNA (cytosine1962-C5)-methyltransferase
MAWEGIGFLGRFTTFRHLGVFPEQAPNWAWLDARLAASGRPLKILNLFGYTGVASLVAARRGARVAHVDASRKAVSWARENADLARLSGASVRWICEDARKWVRREARRGARYDGVILDPPKYGRGPAGEVWRLHQDLPDLMEGVAGLLSDDAAFLLLNAYSERLSGLALASLLAEVLAGREGRIDFGELALQEEGRAWGAGLSFFARWSAP